MDTNRNQGADLLRLALAAANNDNAALRSLVEQLGPKIRRFVRGAFPSFDGHAVQTVVNDTLRAVLKGATTFRGYSPDAGARVSFATWVFSIAKRLAYSEWKGGEEKKLRLEAVGEEILTSIDGGEPSPEENFSKSEIAALLLECLQELKPKARECVILKYWLSLSIREIEKIVGCSTTTVWSYLDRAQKQLRSCLEPKGVLGPSP